MLEHAISRVSARCAVSLAVCVSLLVWSPAGLAAEPAPADGAATTTGAANEAEAEAEEAFMTDSLESYIRVFQQRPILKASRFELALTGGFAAADTMYSHTLASVSGRFHISEFVSIGASFSKYFSSESALFERVIADFELFPERSEMQWYAGGDVSVVPIDGKFVLFDDVIIYFDLYAMLGGGVTRTNRSDAAPTGMLGVGMRFYLTEWLTLTFELRDHIYAEDFNAGTEIINNIVGQGGISIFIPFGFDYTYPR